MYQKVARGVSEELGLPVPGRLAGRALSRDSSEKACCCPPPWATLRGPQVPELKSFLFVLESGRLLSPALPLAVAGK